MSAPPPIIETADAFLGRLAALDLQAAEHVHAELLATTKPAEVADLARAYARASRCLRQTLALHAKLTDDRARAAREAERHAAQMARDAADPASRRDPSDPDHDPDQVFFDDRVEDLREAMGRIISKSVDGDLTRHTRLIHRFERELYDWCDSPDFLEWPLDRLVERACQIVNLPQTLAGGWRDLPLATFFPEPEELAVFDDDDEDPPAGDGAPPDDDGEPPDPGADPAPHRGSG